MRNLDVLWKACWIPDREVWVRLHTSSKSASFVWSSFDMHIIRGIACFKSCISLFTLLALCILALLQHCVKICIFVSIFFDQAVQRKK